MSAVKILTQMVSCAREKYFLKPVHMRIFREIIFKVMVVFDRSGLDTVLLSVSMNMGRKNTDAHSDISVSMINFSPCGAPTATMK